MRYAYLEEMFKLSPALVSRIHDDNELIDVIGGKFTARNAKSFIAFSELSLNEFSGLLPRSKRTLQRILEKSGKPLEFELTEALVEIGEVYSIGLRAFDGSKERLNSWLNSENAYFRNKRPVDIMHSHKGRDLIKDELNRIEYGEFS
jgi:hypothetical protein